MIYLMLLSFGMLGLVFFFGKKLSAISKKQAEEKLQKEVKEMEDDNFKTVSEKFERERSEKKPTEKEVEQMEAEIEFSAVAANQLARENEESKTTLGMRSATESITIAPAGHGKSRIEEQEEIITNQEKQD